MTFIHGGAVWGPGPVDLDASDVHVMAGRLSAQPWATTSVVVSQGRGFRAALGAQRLTGEPEAVASRAGVLTALDLRLDDGKGVRDLVGLPPEAPDAHVMLSAYQRWADSTAARIRGDGVFALWDERRERLLCWRDVAGTRPLYYTGTPGRLVLLSSDLRSLTAHPRVPARLDLQYARSLIEHGAAFQHPSRTLCADVRKLPAGHVLVADAAGTRVSPYWSANEVPQRRHHDDRVYGEELRELLDVSVRSRLGDSTSLAAHLSGGLDSTSIAVSAHRAFTGSQFVGVSWAPPRRVLESQPTDERDLVDETAAREGLSVNYTAPTAADIAETETRDIALRPTTTLQVELTAARALSRSGVTTILSGWGGDELAVYNGKGYFASLAVRGRLPTLWREITARSRLHGSTRAAEIRGRVVLPLLPDRLAQVVNPGLRQQSLTLPSYLQPEMRAALTHVEPLPYPMLRERPGVRESQIARLGWGHLQYRMESWAAHGADLGLTYRYPLLDRRIIEFALSIPDHLYFRDGWKRWIYRTAMEGILPDEVRWNPHKHDSAMTAMLRRLRPDTLALVASRVAEQRRNPFIDVDGLLAATPSPGTGSAMFLAFTKVAPP